MRREEKNLAMYLFLTLLPWIWATERRAILWFKQQVALPFLHFSWQETFAVCGATFQETLTVWIITSTNNMYVYFYVVNANRNREILDWCKSTFTKCYPLTSISPPHPFSYLYQTIPSGKHHCRVNHKTDINSTILFWSLMTISSFIIITIMHERTQKMATSQGSGCIWGK